MDSAPECSDARPTEPTTLAKGPSTRRVGLRLSSKAWEALERSAPRGRWAAFVSRLICAEDRRLTVRATLFDDVLDEAFLAKLAPPNERGCRLWLGTVANGYGSFRRRGYRRYAHRYAWARVHGPIPAGMFVCHECDTPLCCEISHLFLGTPKENTADCIRKGRYRNARGLKMPPQGVLRGERKARAKLTDEMVRSIRAIFAAGGTNKCELGRRFGVSTRAISLVIQRRRWAHVQ